ncbi:sigma-54-dependent Fis family transcriptional regulator [Desulfosarcina ovata subsp. sediminis]|uniref:Sigma-54-dependent Fis family transcriptional regulator n=1 Tax=Desulfosarcina ovata subsp. sediminis TaxID=885957 RepID=A0A5K7ZY11_9BACT|nr:sigma-54 dependent transcriptional regulator [Desulfosarcina ovata]BBO85159.1 sigma-54-dependent Fis family transcriptional regulator [Desulfosarcina ovata subsp. sediminis]
MFPSILIVDDEPSIVQSLSGLLSDEGFEVITASNGYEALKTIDTESPDLVLLDIWMPGIDGIETLKEIKKNHAALPVIIITGHGNVETAVKATKLGAYDLIEKPLNIDKVIVAINNALNFRRLEEENRYLRKKTIERHSISGNSPPVQALKQQIATVAPTESWVLIKGENGTGKELVARTIHQLSPRAESPLIDVNCAAIPESLIESELFGHEKGSVPGSSTKKRGKFELANTGTIFLDEIGDMSINTQAKILRVLDEKKFQRVGGGRDLTMDVRVIAATNKDLEEEIANGRFREDLYYRLNVVPIEVVPLRERADDIPVLADIFLAEAATSNREKRKAIAPDAMAVLAKYSWPGNVRELKNLIERLAIMVENDVIRRHDLPAQLSDPKAAAGELFSIENLESARRAFEAEYVSKKLAANDNNVAKTARAIGVKAAYIKSLLTSGEK